MNFPSNIPVLTSTKLHYKWIYRGKGWISNTRKIITYATFKEGSGKDSWGITDGNPVGCADLHYAELVEDNPTLEYQIELAKSMVGKTFQFNKFIPEVILSWGITQEKELSSLVISEIENHGVCVYVHDSFGSYIPVLNTNLVEVTIPEFLILKLNANYDAKVYKDKIEVGCQTFPINILNQLLDLHTKLDKQ